MLGVTKGRWFVVGGGGGEGGWGSGGGLVVGWMGVGVCGGVGVWCGGGGGRVGPQFRGYAVSRVNTNCHLHSIEWGGSKGSITFLFVWRDMRFSGETSPFTGMEGNSVEYSREPWYCDC